MNHESLVKTQLEKILQTEFDCAAVCTVSNGTHAIEVLLTAMDLPRGAKVLLPELSFIATATAVARCGLVPVYADISTEYLGLTLASIKQKAEQNIAAVIVVHLAGLVNRELDEIAAYCRAKTIPLIEDCAQVHHAYFKGIRVGNFGIAATTSFQSSKLFNCGEGGAIFSSDDALITQCKAICNWGWPGEGHVAQLNIPSSNYRLGYLQCERLISEINLAKIKVNKLRAFYTEIAQAAERFGKTFLLTKFEGDIVDCPFFFMVTHCQPIHQLEPRGEYPMSRSSVVRAILRKWFPDLLACYDEANAMASTHHNSHYVVKNYAFLRISQFDSVASIEAELQAV